MSATPSARLALIDRFPGLAASLARAPLCRLPTPVSRTEKLAGEAATGPLFVKRDEQSAEPYGGNKPRKLEWILGDAHARGRRRLLTFGGLGTNHGLATALYARRLGLECELVLVHQPVDRDVRRKLQLAHAAGARLHYAGGVVGAAGISAVRLLRHPRTVLVATGGSNPLGTVGCINAGLELAAQVREGLLPEPARIYVALGSGGTAAGLAAGVGLAGLRTRVVAVLVSDILPPGPRRLARLARRALRRLRAAGAALEVAAVPLPLELEVGFRGPGYGHATEAGTRAVRAAADLEGLRLETTYTGKALAALLARERGRGEPVLFWNSYAGTEPDLPLPEPAALPRRLRRFLGPD